MRKEEERSEEGGGAGRRRSGYRTKNKNPTRQCGEQTLRLQNQRYLKFKKAATCSHSSGRKWPQVAARASGRKWPQVAARGRMWPVVLLVGFEISRAASLAAICIICSHLQPLAATCGHLQPLEWPQVAAGASGRKWPQVAAWTANTSPNGPTLENLKKMLFSRTAFFSSFL